VTPCPACGQENPDNAKFCLECGAALVRAQARGEERKVVTVLFADLVGFTSRSERLDVEDVRGTLQPYHALLRGELERHGGTVEKFIGDAVMALFGAPVAHEDDPERAVRAALAIQVAVARLREHDPRLDLHVRIGVNTGEALVALDAAPASGQGMAFGDVVNTAARLESAAPVDGVLVGEATFRATNHVVEYTAADPIAAKGKHAPVPGWHARRARSRFGSDVDASPATALVGRERELRLIRDAVERAHGDGTPQLVTLVGVPGIGKSRLVSELFQVLDRDAGLVTWRQGRSLPYDEPVAFWSLGEIVEAQAGILHSDSAQVAGEKLHQGVAALIPADQDAARVEAHLRRLLGLETAAEQVGADRLAPAFAAWRQFIEALAGQRPSVVVFEDIHWADDGLLDFVDHLMEWVTDLPLLILCTARPELLERRMGWGGRKPNGTTLELAPLSGADTARLVSELLEQAVLPADVQEALVERTAGNALYAQEYVRMLIDRGFLTRGERSWRFHADEELPLPETIQGLIAARLDAMSKEEKDVVQDAAVIGKVVWAGAVAHVGGRDRREADDLLHRAARRNLLRREPRAEIAGETEYAFQHALIRDVAYAGITRAARAAKHERAADWIASLASEREDRAQLVAHHLLRAVELYQATGAAPPEVSSRAASSALAAADHALSVNAFRVARDYFDRALALLEDGHPERWRALVGRGRAAMYEADAIDPAFEQAALAPPMGTAGTTAGFVLGELAVWHANHADTGYGVELGERALELVVGEPASGEKAFVLAGFGSILAFTDRDVERGAALMRESVDISRATGATDTLSATMLGVGMCDLKTGDVQATIEQLEAALGIARGTSSVWGVLTFVNGGWVALILADIAMAHDLYQEGLAAVQALGSRTFEAPLREGLAEVAFHRGRWAEGRSLADPTAGLALHRIELMSGRIDAARRALDESFPLLQSGEAGPRRELELLQAHCLARLGEVRLAGQAIAGVLGEAGGLLGGVGCGLLDLALAASLADVRDTAANAIAEQPLVTPWSRAAAAALRSDWDESLQLLRTIGSLPYEAAVLDLALAEPSSRDAETARRARMREIRALIPELAVGDGRVVPGATSAADAG
jgi:class 3 adenylate cyclase